MFPYENNSFDIVFLFSVFTHMQPLEVQNYFNEIQRVLKPNGRCLATFFLYDDQIEYKISKNNGTYSFPYCREKYKLMNEKVPSANIAFKENYIEEITNFSSLKLKDKIYGTWTDRANSDLHDFQDILVFKKE